MSVKWSGQPWVAVPVELLEDSRLSPPARVLFGILAGHLIDKDHCWPGQQRLAEKLNVTARAVRNYLKELQDAGWIEVEERAGASSIYRLNPGTSVPTTPEQPFRTPRNERSTEVDKEKQNKEPPTGGGEELRLPGSEVFAHFAATFNPRSKKPDPGQLRIIAAALKEGTVEELCRCIDAAHASDWHQKRGEHENRKGKKHNTLSAILKPKQRSQMGDGYTQRERIDFWLDREPAPAGPSQEEIDKWNLANARFANGTGPDPGPSPWNKERGQ